jgi:hypothetical protein
MTPEASVGPSGAARKAVNQAMEPHLSNTFGSVSTLAGTCELRRRAFNEAFSAYGLDWDWSREDYVSMLGSNGGAPTGWPGIPVSSTVDGRSA